MIGNSIPGKKEEILWLWQKIPFLAIFMLTCCNLASGQTSISSNTSFTNTETANTVTFNFQNTNTYPVMITDIAGIAGAYGNSTVELWYKTSALNGPPGNISTANGWTQAATNTFPGIGNTTTQVTQPFLSGLQVLVPANSTYALAVAVYNTAGGGGIQRTGAASGTVTLSGGGCNVITGTNIGYSGTAAPPATPAATPKGWIGKITFIPGNNCTGIPAAAVISGPGNVCTGALFTLTASGYAMGPGISYQWQTFNTTSGTWVDIAGATATAYTGTAGITASTQFRLKTLCATSSTQNTSNALTVNIGSGLPGGTYTINNNLPSSSANFVSFKAAAAAMSCGISGAVTLNVAPGSGPYTESVTFNNVPGTSSANKIRLNGNGAVLQYVNTNDEITILNIKGTDFMTIDSLTIRTLDTMYGYGVTFSDTSRYDSLTHCFVDMTSLSTVNASTTCGISLSRDLYTSTDNRTTSHCFIGYNHVLGSNGPGGPYLGITDGWYNNVASDFSDTGNIIAYNEVENFTYFGISISGSNGTQILHNDIHRKNKVSAPYFVGIRSWGGSGNFNNTQTYNTDIKIIGNRIHDPSSTNSQGFFYGIENYNNNYYNNQTGTQNTLIANNVIYNINISTSTTQNIYGIIFWSGDNYNNNANTSNTKIYHNTIDFNQAIAGAGSMAGIYGYGYNYNSNNNSDVYVRNNLITITGGSSGSKYGFYFYDYPNNNNTYDNLIMQKNNYYLNSTLPGNQYVVHYMNTDYPTLSAFQTAYPLLETGSLSVNPQYTSPATGDFTPLNYSLFGNGTNVQADVPKDILGRIRSVTPTPGAFEIAIDAGVSALVAPLGTYCSSVKEVKVSLTNSGIITINNVQVNWTLNGVAQPAFNYTGTLLPNNSTTISLGNGLFMPNTPVIIKAWTSMPNGQQDGLPFNDTLVVTTQSSTSVSVDLGPDHTICTGNTTTLDAGYPGAVYLWDNNSTTQTRTVSVAGNYYVRLTALDGCIGVDTFHLDLRPLPVVNLGLDREICLGQTTTFDAGHPGATYLWDDGTVQQTRTVDTAGSYEAQVTDGFGCMGVDNVNVGMKDIPMVSGINATHADSGTYTFYPINPRYTLSYRWNFGDGSPEATGYFVQHTYVTKGIYTVTLYLEGECTGLIIDESRTVDVFSVGGGATGMDDLNADGGEFTLFPNPAKDIVTIRNASSAKMQRVYVYNALGQMIFSSKAGSAAVHQLKTTAMANGLYTIRIETDKGFVTRKFEVVR